MSLTLLYGSSVSLRTEQLCRELIRSSLAFPERSFIMLVPEQASLSAQQDLVRLHPRHALTNVDVLTFNRLAYRVFEDLAEPGKHMIDDSGKMMLLRLVLEQQKDRLKVLKRSLGKPGFTDEVKSVITELAEYNVSAAELEEQLPRLMDHPALYDKLKDLSVLYTEFMHVLHENYEMAEERTTRLAARIPDWGKTADTCFYLDGFTGFTPPQYAVLKRLLEKSPEVAVGITLGEGERAEDHENEDALFYMSAHMASQLKELAIRSSVPYRELQAEGPEKRTAADGRFSAETLHLERAIYRYPARPFPEKTDRVRIVRAANRREEVEAVLKEVLSAVREGLSFRDMAIITGDVEGFREEIETAFGRADVPYFIDASRGLSGHPLILLVTEALRTVEEDFSFDSFFACAKNPLVSAALSRGMDGSEFAPYERICELENYALALGIRGRSAYTKEFTRRYRGFSEIRLPAVNETRARLSAPLLALADALKEKNTNVRGMLTALYQFLVTLHAEEELKRLADAFRAEGESELAREYEGAFPQLIRLFESMEAILGDEVLPLETFTETLSAGLSRLTVGLVPPTLDRLVIGDLKRTRLGKIRRLFILGANDGVLPPVKADGGLLSEADRMLLSENEMQLAPTAREDSFTMQFYLYLLLTKPMERLYLSYAAGDESGRLLAASPLIEDLKALFPALVTEKAAPGILSEKSGLLPLSDALRTLYEDGEAPDDMSAALYRRLKEGSGAKEGACTREDAAFPAADPLLVSERGFLYRYHREALSEETARRLFRETLNGSVTKLEKYAGCAYAHFLNYGLRLLPREKYLLEAADYGNLFHNSINRFFEKLKLRGMSFHGLDEETKTVLVQESVAEITEEYGNAILKDSARNSYLVERVRRLTDRTLFALTKQWESGGYTETESEVPFGPRDGIPALTLPLGEGLRLSLEGRIDRLDHVTKDGVTYVKVIDYKSSQKELDPTRIYYGLQLQLLIYLKAAGELMKKRDPGSEIIPAGIYYYTISDPIVEPKENKTAEEQILEKLRLHGYTNTEGESLTLLDRAAVEERTGSTVAIGVKVNKDGSLYKSGRLMDSETLSRFSDYAVEKARQLSSELIRGNIEIDPYEYGNYSSCTYCEFRSVCGFDRRVEGFRPRLLAKKTAEDIKGA